VGIFFSKGNSCRETNLLTKGVLYFLMVVKERTSFPLPETSTGGSMSGGNYRGWVP